MSREIEISVQSLLPGGHPQGHFKLRVSPDATVDALLHDLCTEASVTIRYSVLSVCPKLSSFSRNSSYQRTVCPELSKNKNDDV